MLQLFENISIYKLRSEVLIYFLILTAPLIVAQNLLARSFSRYFVRFLFTSRRYYFRLNRTPQRTQFVPALVSSRYTFTSQYSASVMETLTFDNRALKKLPIDNDKLNYVRTVSGACFSLVKPTPVENPILVAHSTEALSLLGIDQSKESVEKFVEYFSGNALLPGSQPAAHCYCGHQFGYFSGQLGDGAAMYLGEVINGSGQRWELQLKGAGKTPYSRTADGRKVLRSSIREFLCSEAMHHLGVPTTRAGSCVTSDSRVVRDIFYSGNPIEERCTIISRIAPTFIRFGSFEIFKTRDAQTARQGPSLGRQDVKQQLVEYCISTFFPGIHAKEISLLEKTREFFREVVLSTALLVSHWQTVGFCHGVLNTDNMSILGLTIDYGPFGFMDHYNPDFICNGSDDGGRYTFDSQPEICGWNLRKLAEALDPILPLSAGQQIIEEYMPAFEREYLSRMRRKLGLQQEQEGDSQLVRALMDTMQKTYADFTNTFRNLNLILVPGVDGFEASKTACLDKLLSQCSTIEELKKVSTSKMDPQQIQLILQLMQQSPQFADARMVSKVKSELDKLNSQQDLEKKSQGQKSEKDRSLWSAWLDEYAQRLSLEAAGGDPVSVNSSRITVMNRSNPVIVLRNYVAQAAIEAAEKGDYSEVNRVLELLKRPFDQPTAASPSMEAATPLPPSKIDFSEKPPISALGICVT